MDNNSIDFGKIYGISGNCAGGPCDLTGNIVPNTPSLEQIASYNVQLRAREIPNPEVERKLRTLEDAIGEDIITTAPKVAGTGDTPMSATQMAANGQTMQTAQSPQTMNMTHSMGDMSDTDYNNPQRWTTPQTTQQTLGTPMMSGTPAGSDLAPITSFNQPYPITGESIQYLNGFMRTQIGRRVEIQMLVGSDTLVTKEGFLLGIGANYILINETGTNDLTSCDFYNIKFVRYFY